MTAREYRYLRRKGKLRRERQPVKMYVTESGFSERGGIVCDGCGNRFDKNVMHKCTNDWEEEWLCPDCNDGTFYCMSCGSFCAGMGGSFEWGPYKGYCDNCRDEFEQENSWDRDEEDYGYNGW